MKQKNRIIITIGLMILSGFCIQWSFSVAISLILGFFPDVMESYNVIVDELITYDFKSVIYVGLLAPLVEEIVFRIAIIRLGTMILPFWSVNILQAVIFGIYHGNIVQGIYAFILGLLLGYVFHDSRVLYMSIVLHMSINLFGIMIDLISRNPEIEGSPLVYVIAVLSVIAGAASVIICHKLWNDESVMMSL